MDRMLSEFKNIIDENVTNYIQKIADMYGLDETELLDLWFDHSKTSTKQPDHTNKVKHDDTESVRSSVTTTSAVTTASKVSKASKVSVVKNTSTSDNLCPYVFMKGSKSGQMCGVRAKTGTYCSKHKKCEEAGPKIKKEPVVPAAKKAMSKTIKEPKTTSVKPVEIQFNMNKKIGRHVNPQSSMVIKSATERVVIGKLVNDEIKPLNNEDLDTCRKFGFRYDETCVEGYEPAEPAEQEKVEQNEEILHDSDNDDDEELNVESGHIACRKITAIPDSVLSKKKVSDFRKSLSKAIEQTHIKAKDVEKILGELQVGTEMDNLSDVEEELEEELVDEELEEELVDEDDV
jgi:hypothetical protein